MADDVKSSNSAQTLFLEKQPCCIAIDPYKDETLIVGTYALEEGDGNHHAEPVRDSSDEPSPAQTRNGSLEVLTLLQGKFSRRQTVPLDFGVLDVHFHPHIQGVLGVASSTGSVVLFKCGSENKTEDAVSIQHLTTLQIASPTTVVTAFAWDPLQDSRFGATTSTGEVLVVDIEKPNFNITDPEAKPLFQSESVYTHDLEAWILSFSQSTIASAGLFSGGDDATIQWTGASAWAKDGELSGQTLSPTASMMGVANRRIHGAGVTAILPLLTDEQIIATGSYDDRLRVLRYPPLPGQRAEVLAEADLGGGVWRLLPVEITREESGRFDATLLICCMYAGARIVRLTRASAQSEWSLQVLAEFTEHESMCYGGVVIPQSISADDGERMYVTCSFYDRRLCLWRV